MRDAFNAYLRDGVFPGEWKEASLVLIPKLGKPGKYRPICMLGKMGKLFERIVAERIVRVSEGAVDDRRSKCGSALRDRRTQRGAR